MYDCPQCVTSGLFESEKKKVPRAILRGAAIQDPREGEKRNKFKN
jgi:hypothetical protein